MSNFTQFNLPKSLIDSLLRMQIQEPTPIQKEAIPLILEHHDLLASAQTGSGKTLAFVLPLVLKLLNDKKANALILVPTRELAVQVSQTLQKILHGIASMPTTLLIGGAPMGKQFAELKRRPRIVVGTPGRINDHLNRQTLHLNQTRFLVVDEADRMLDMGFGIQLDQIAEYLPEERQTLMFSATVDPRIEKMSKKYLKNPKQITIAPSIQTTPKIKQEIVEISFPEKLNTLLEQINQRLGSLIVFVRTRRGTDSLCKQLQEYGHHAAAIHGDLRQSKRDSVIRDFRNQKTRILVATDVAARGLDIPHVAHVINYNLPECPEDYIHRIGRTARAGAEGSALCLITPDEVYKWRDIRKLLDPEIAKTLTLKSDGKFNPGQRPPKHSRNPTQKKFWKGGRQRKPTHRKAYK